MCEDCSPGTQDHGNNRLSQKATEYLLPQPPDLTTTNRTLVYSQGMTAERAAGHRLSLRRSIQGNPTPTGKTNTRTLE